MLTPQEVREKKFKQVIVGGYDMGAVDEFLEEVTKDFTTLFKENAILKNKMKVLVDKIEEYRSNDESIRQAYLAIKRQAESELRDAREEVSRLMNEATGEMGKRKDELAALIETEEIRFKTAKEQTVTFVRDLRKLYTEQMDKLSIIPEMEIEEPPRRKREENVREVAREIEEAITVAAPEEEKKSDTLTYPVKKEGQGDGKDSSLQVQSFEINFSDSKNDFGKISELSELSDIWEHEHDTEVPRPKYDFADLDKKFGHDIPQKKQRSPAEK